MKVAQISTMNGSVSDGTSMRVSGLSRGLQEIGHSVTTICSSGSEDLAGDFGKVDIRLLGLLRELYGYRSPLELLLMGCADLRSAAYRAISPLPNLLLDMLGSCTILHCHEHSATSIVEHLKRTPGQKLLFDYHGMTYLTDVAGRITERVSPRCRAIASGWEQRVFGKADMISFVSPLLRDRIIELTDVDREKTCIIPDGVDHAHISGGWKQDEVCQLRRSWGSEDATIVMYMGSIDPLHGGDYLMDVVHAVLSRAETAQDVRCVIIGVKAMARNVARLQTTYPGRLIFVPGVSYTMLPTYLASSDILLVPHPRNLLMDSIESGKLLTYLASGKPTVVTGLTCAREFLDDGVNSVLCDPDSPSTMVDGIERLITSPELRERIGYNGSMLVRENRDWSCIARTCTDVYGEMMSR